MKKEIRLSALTLFLGLAASTQVFAQAAPESTEKEKMAAPTSMQFGKGDLTAVEVKNLHHSGKLLVKKIKVTDSTIINGFLEATDSQFSKESVVNGNLSASASSFNDLTVNGNVKLTTVVVNGTSTINGKVTADKSDFKNKLSINGQLQAKDSKFAKLVTLKSLDSEFDSCKVDSITVQKTATDGVQKIVLKGSSVSGDIIFDSGKGIVEQDSASTIGGKVVGGTVEKK